MKNSALLADTPAPPAESPFPGVEQSFIIWLIVFYFVSQGVEWSSGLALSTLRNSRNEAAHTDINYFNILMEFSGVFFFVSIHYCSLWFQKRLRGLAINGQTLVIFNNHALSVKFQIEETLRMTRLFLPIVVLKCTLQILSSVASVITYKTLIAPNADTQMIVYELVNIAHIQPYL
uniref:Uncharacterized protein n=1 Tax=Ditylenchus dipsaci TaxID=166011 RepID=A0A915E8L8_9BILA